MPNIAKRMSNVSPSAIVQVTNKVRAMKAEGRKVISFSIGVPNFTPPQHLFDAAHKEIDEGTLAYLPGRGTDELINAYLYRLEQDGFAGYKKENVAVTLGAKNALFDLFYSLIDEGDEVIIPTPYWTSYADWVDMVSAKGVYLRCGAEQNYKLTPEQLENAITPKTKMFLFNNPSNPTGMVYTRDEIKAIADVLVKHDIWIISDDIYDKLIFDGEKFHHLLHVCPELQDRMIMTQSISKTYGLPGWRVGMVAAPEAVTKQILTMTSNTIMNVPGVMMAAAAAAFKGPHGFMGDLRTIFAEKRNMVMDSLAKVNGINCPKPQGAFYAFPDVSAYFGKTYNGKKLNNDVDVVEAILEEKEVAMVPGSAFGEPNSMRISYACSNEDLTEGLKRIEAFFAEIQ